MASLDLHIMARCTLWCVYIGGSIIEARRQSGMQSVTIRANLRPFRDHDAREAISCNQLQSVAIRVNRGQSVVKQRLGRVNHKSNHMQSVPIRANQCQFETIQRPSERQSVAIRCNQGPSVVNNSALAGSIIVSNQMQSVPIRAHQSQSQTMKRASSV